MTNTEAILRLKDHFAIHDDGRPTPYLDEAERMAIEALEIADRLEQMWEEVKDKEFPPSMFQNCRECGDYKQGRKDALADLRGDTE